MPNLVAAVLKCRRSKVMIAPAPPFAAASSTCSSAGSRNCGRHKKKGVTGVINSDRLSRNRSISSAVRPKASRFFRAREHRFVLEHHGDTRNSFISPLIQQDQQPTGCPRLTAQSRNKYICIQNAFHIAYDMQERASCQPSTQPSGEDCTSECQALASSLPFAAAPAPSPFWCRRGRAQPAGRRRVRYQRARGVSRSRVAAIPLVTYNRSAVTVGH